MLAGRALAVERDSRCCPVCGEALHPTRIAKYCSRGCANDARRLWHEAHPGGNRPKRQAPATSRHQAPAIPEPPRAVSQPATRACRKTACGREFVPHHPRQRYCSLECQQTRHAGTAQRPVFELRRTRGVTPRPSNSPGRTAALKSAQAQKTRRERERDEAQQQQAAEERRQEVIRPHFRLIVDPRVVIRPGRPAPVKRYTNGAPCEFQDDLGAMADHGSPRSAMPPLPDWGYARMSALVGVG